MDLSPDSFHLALVNPPYDHTPGQASATNRLESVFLERSTTALAPHGILVYIVPQAQLARDSLHLASNYNSVRVFRFPDLHYPTFRQAVLIGRRNQRIHQSLNVDRDIHQYLQEQAQAGENAVPIDTIPWDTDRATVPLTFGPFAGHLPEIRRNADSDENIRMHLRHSDAYRHPNILARTAPAPDRQHFFNPLEPLRRGHLCILAANGQFDQTPLHDPTGLLPPIVITGDTHRESRVVDSDDETTTEQDFFAASIRVMDLHNGEIANIGDDPEDLHRFLLENQSRLEHSLSTRHTPSIDPSHDRYADVRARIASLSRRPIGKQAASAITAAVAIAKLDELFLVGQPGIGKTFLTIAAVRGANFSRILVTTPSHNPVTWVREISATWPQARIRIVNAIGNPNHPDASTYDLKIAETDLETVRQTPADPEAPVWAILKRDTAKRAYPYALKTRVICANPKDDSSPRRLYREQGRLIALKPDDRASYHTCPHCWHPLGETPKPYEHRDARCPNCNAPLTQPECKTAADRRIPWTEYIARKMPHWADVFVIDEAHQYKSRDSAQGENTRRLAQASRRVIALTGTLIGGKATDAFYLLVGISKRFRRQFGYHDRKLFLKLYGREERVYAHSRHEPGVRDGARSSRRTTKVQTHEINGFKPTLMNHFWENTIFTRIPDIAPHVPEPVTEAHLIPLDHSLLTDADGNSVSQADAYASLAQALREYHDASDANQSFTLKSRMRQELLAYPENCWQTTSPMGVAGEPIVTMPALPADVVYPKEQHLIDLLAQHKALGNRCLIYCTHTQKRDVTKRLAKILANAGISARVLPKIAPAKRLEWLEKTARSCDAVICHPQSVETGLNLLQFPTIIWYEIDYSLYLIEQASARSHRINQDKPVTVHFLAYAETLQERALRIIAAKADAGRLIYGELSSTGLSAFNPDTDDFRAALARELFESTAPTDQDSINALFSQNRETHSQRHDQSSAWLAFADRIFPEFAEPVATTSDSLSATPAKPRTPRPRNSVPLHQPTLF